MTRHHKKQAQIWRKRIQIPVGFNYLDILVGRPWLFSKSRLTTRLYCTAIDRKIVYTSRHDPKYEPVL